MASRRRLRLKECLRKVRYATEAEARQALHHARRRGRVEGITNTYRCKWCGGFHWGHARGSSTAGKRRGPLQW